MLKPGLARLIRQRRFNQLRESLREFPAAASAPFVATLVDVTGLAIYFSIAYQILPGTRL